MPPARCPRSFGSKYALPIVEAEAAIVGSIPTRLFNVLRLHWGSAEILYATVNLSGRKLNNAASVIDPP